MKVTVVPTSWLETVICDCKGRMWATKGNTYKCHECGQQVPSETVTALQKEAIRNSLQKLEELP